MSMKIGETNYTTFDDLWNDSILTPVEKADIQQKVYKKMKTKLAIAEQSKLAGEPTVSLEKAKLYLEEKYKKASQKPV
ncbi:MAG: hypothetical protein PHX01_07215 [Clostridia bacterium]|jgi:hypothetical protein|nr:hypothetical protein [Clostridia bacterium]